MPNRIDKLIKKGIENPARFEKELAALEKVVKDNPDKKEQLLNEFRKSLDNKEKTELKISINDLSRTIFLLHQQDQFPLKYVL